MDAFKLAYVAAAHWSSMDDADDRGGEPLDANYCPSDIAPDTLAKIESDCRAFQRDNAADIGAELLAYPQSPRAGFWDGDWPHEAGERLTAASHAAGEFELYVGDDGLLHG